MGVLDKVVARMRRKRLKKLVKSNNIEYLSDIYTDEEKKDFINSEHFKRLYSSEKVAIIKAITDEAIREDIIVNSDAISNLWRTDIIQIIDTLSDEAKIRIIYNKEFREKHKITLIELIELLSDESKLKILRNDSFLKQELQDDIYRIKEIVKSLEKEEDKLEIIKLYDFAKWAIIEIFETFSDVSKIAIILKNEYDFYGPDFTKLIASLSIDSLIGFLRDNKVFLEENGIIAYIHDITRRMSTEKQVEFVARFDEMDLDLDTKRKILVVLSKEAKIIIDTSSIPTQFVTAIEMNYDTDTLKRPWIRIDFNSDLEMYRGLDELIYLNGMEVSEEDKPKLLKLCEICPRMSIKNNIPYTRSTVEEYKSGENWIQSVLLNCSEGWSDIQKVAFIDYSIGKKISYSPDLDTEIFWRIGAHSLWKIIISGYGICNGVAELEEYMLKKVGIDVEKIYSDEHAFLKLKNLQIPTVNGEILQGDTILDPTWNLAAHRYGCMPQNFCRSYAQIRKNDITDDGIDTEAHKNDKDLASATLDLDEQSLRRIFTSIGVADKDGKLPIKTLMDRSKMIATSNKPEEEKIKEQLALIVEFCPEFATCQNSTMFIVQGILSKNYENLKFNECVVDRCYARKDESQRPIVYVYVDFPKKGKKFYVADIESFVELSQIEFEAEYECYKMDIEKNCGYRPWEKVNELGNQLYSFPNLEDSKEGEVR